MYADLRGYTEGQEPVQPGEALEVFLRRQVLASRRVLMVLDNARSEGQVRPLLPGAGGTLALVTSRSALSGLEADVRIDLDVLPEGEAATMLGLLVGATRAKAEPRAIAELAELCGRLPLALRIAAQVLATHPAWPTAKMVRLLAQERGRLERLGAGDLSVRRRSRCGTGSWSRETHEYSGYWACIRGRISLQQRRGRWLGSRTRKLRGC